MKQILASAMIIAALGALVVSSTVALFSDQETIAGNTVATGTLELTLNHTAGKPYAITGGYPGYMTDWEWIDIYNTGDLPFEAYMSFAKTGGSTTLYDALKMELYATGTDDVCGGGDDVLIYNGYIKNFPTSKLVSSYWHHANEDDGTGGPDNIRAGWTMGVCQRLSISSTAGNEIMGKTVTFSEIVDAMQDND